MTPEEAQALEPGTTPGPWKARHGSDNTSYVQEAEWLSAIGSAEFGHVEAEYTPADANLIAAAPDMRATIAALRWEYAVEVRPDEDSEWQHAGPWWDTIEKARAWRGTAVIRIGQPYPQDRIVRRPFGPREVVKDSVRTVEGHN